MDFIVRNPCLTRLFEARVAGSHGGGQLRPAVALLVELDDLIEDENQKDESYNELLKSYRVNLIRCDVVQKLATELSYARAVLARAVRKQKNLRQARMRVDWLEKEIEKNIFANKNVCEREKKIDITKKKN